MTLRGLLGAAICAAGILIAVGAFLPTARFLLDLHQIIPLSPAAPPGVGAIVFAPKLDNLRREIETWKRVAGDREQSKFYSDSQGSTLDQAEARLKGYFTSYPPPPPPDKKKSSKTGTSPSTPRLYDGRILFEPERTMELHHAELIMVRMDAGASRNLESGIDPAKYKIDSVKIGQRMRVHLDGNPPDAFDIVPMSPPDEQQAVTNLSASTWMWNVTPKKNGAAALLLNIWALAKVEDTDTLVPLFQKTETIHVRGIPIPEVNAETLWDKMLEKIAEHAGEAIWGACGVALAALGGWIGKWWKKPKTAAASTNP